MSNNLNLALTLLANGDSIAQIICATLNLDAVVQELLKGGKIENLVVYSLRGIDGEFLCDFGALLGRAALLEYVVSLLLSRPSGLRSTDSKAVNVLRRFGPF
jgi:hypothetical protein